MYSDYDKILSDSVDRAIKKHNMPLAELIESENLQTYARGYVDILSADPLNNAMVPCRGFMILARSRYDEAAHDHIAEYAIYRRTGKDTFGEDITGCSGNVFICEAEYALDFVGKETFESMAHAIKYAVELIEKMADDPVEIVRNMTDGDPAADLAEADAVRLIAEAVNLGYAVPANLTAEKFLEIYEDLKPEEE